MNDASRRGPSGPSGPSKSHFQGGISAAEARQLKERIEALEKLVREQFDEKNQWNSVVREWTGKTVIVLLSVNETIVGTLQWVDRYTICVMSEGDTVVIHKAAVVCIRRASRTSTGSI